MRRVSSAIALLLFAASLRASCGSSSCPIDLNALNAPVTGQIGFDLSFQYINQNRPRIGTHSAFVGEIPTDHDEVKTTNRIATALLTYAATNNLQLTLAVPWVSRSHLHFTAIDGESTVNGSFPESWKFDGVGDIVLQSRYRFVANSRATSGGLWLITGVKLPTGSHDKRNALGDIAEITLQPGSGTTDGILGLSWQSGISRPSGLSGPLGHYAVIPFFVSATYQARAGDVDGYRLGNELQVSSGTAIPISDSVVALLQLNGRVREKDRIVSGPPEEDTDFTGGKYLYASPGVRFDVRGVGVYAIVQLPLYQNVNRLQLTSRSNWIVGLQHRFH
ncbi:MAG TPA: hypothetical protein VGK31_10515 [Thermoanaerobaculia bacterium]